MKVLYSWLKDFVDLKDVTPTYLADKLVCAGFEVEEIIDLADSYVNIFVGKILSIEQHPNANKLLICQVDVGDKGHRQIVTGAHNISVGDIVPVCLDGARLPDGKVIRTGELRGVESQGMFCGGSELGLDDADYNGAGFDGIFLLNNAFDPAQLTLGKDINEVIDTKDVLLDVGVTANRPDTNSVYGIAREVAAVLNRPIKPFANIQWKEQGDVKELVKVTVTADDLCPRYMIKGIKDIEIKPSPVLIRRRLRKVGLRPINNVVDATNYVLLEVGQPMHAFDYREVEGQEIVVRRANKGEHIVTLDGKDSELDEDNLVICNANKPMALAGIMGGLQSGIKDDTSTILLESARFRRDNIRRSSKRLGVRSDSSARFEKGIDFISQEWAIERCCSILLEQGVGSVVGGVIDAFKGEAEDRTIDVATDKIDRILGIKVPHEDMVSILNRLSLKTSLKDGVLHVTIPQYREDIVGANDLAEEIIRLYGYDNIVSTPLDGMHQTHGGYYAHQVWIDRIKTLLSGSLGGHECLSYSFVSPKSADLLDLAEGDFRRNVINILNPLGEEVSVMRTNLVHSMLKTVSFNLAHSNKDALLYEVGKIYLPDASAPSKEIETLCLASFGEGRDFYQLKSALDQVASLLNLRFKYVKGAQPFLHPGRNADVLLDGKVIGYIGEVHPLCADRYKLDGRVNVAEINLQELVAAAKDHLPYVALPKYPSISRDLAFVIRSKVTGDEILDTIKSACDDKLEDLYVFDVYEGVGIMPGHKSVAVTVVFRDPDRTLVDNEVVERVDKILVAMKETWGAVLR